MEQRPPSKRPKMSREDRAKQFMPFAALKGYEKALRNKEIEIMGYSNREISADSFDDEFHQSNLT